MGRTTVILADTDQKYIEPLEKRFLEMIDEKIDFEIIADRDYFTSYFESPRTAEILIVGESLYTNELNRHNINHTFLLTEENEFGQTADLSIERVYKYMPIKELFNELTYRSRDILFEKQNQKRETSIISFYSAVGGSGKTSLSMGFAAALAQNHQRVLYINAEMVQAFSFYCENKQLLENIAYHALRDDTGHPFQQIKPYIRNEEFSYIPALNATLDSLNVDNSIHNKIVDGAKKSGNYDFIIVDVESGFGENSAQLLSISNHVMIITMQDEFSVRKTEWILKNFDMRDKERYSIICNKFDERNENWLLKSDLLQKFPFQVQIQKFLGEYKKISDFSKISTIQELALMYI